MTPPAAKYSVFMEIFGEFDSSCTGGVMTPPYSSAYDLNDKSEFGVAVGAFEIER